MSMKRLGKRRVDLADLKTNLFVRAELDIDRAIMLAGIIENGGKIDDDIDVTEEFEIVDGRHRKEAYELAKVQKVDVNLLSFESREEMIAYAYNANSGGSLPPTAKDTEHTVMLLLEEGLGHKRIGELIGLPTSLARRYVNEIKSKQARTQLLKAVKAVADDGLTAVQSAEKYGVDLTKLKEEISGKKRKSKSGVAEIQREFTNRYRTLGHRTTQILRRLREKLEDGDVKVKQVKEIFKHLASLQARHNRSLTDAWTRFEEVIKIAEPEEVVPEFPAEAPAKSRAKKRKAPPPKATSRKNGGGGRGSAALAKMNLKR